MKFRASKSWVLGVILLMFGQMASASVVVGNYDSGNCYPFSCFASDLSGSTYQQVYDASAFGSSMNIGSVSFFQATAGYMDSASYSVSFYLTSNDPLGLSTTGADNHGTLLSTFGDFSLSGLMPSTLTLTGDAFTYDPTLGNLLMEVVVSGLTESHGYESYFQADYTGTTTSRYWAYGGSSTGSQDTGALRTQFDGAREVPLPGTLGLLGLGLAGLGVIRRKKA